VSATIRLRFGKGEQKDESRVSNSPRTTIMLAAKPLNQCVRGGAIASGVAIRHYPQER
jgi:hypothetical protein